jgi:hypothetical protein
LVGFREGDSLLIVFFSLLRGKHGSGESDIRKKGNRLGKIEINWMEGRNGQIVRAGVKRIARPLLVQFSALDLGIPRQDIHLEGYSLCSLISGSLLWLLQNPGGENRVVGVTWEKEICEKMLMEWQQRWKKNNGNRWVYAGQLHPTLGYLGDDDGNDGIWIKRDKQVIYSLLWDTYEAMKIFEKKN